jgi:hypothetical protein
MSRTAVSAVVTARLRVAPVDGEVEWPVTRVSAWMNFWSRKRGKGRWLGFLWVFIPLRRSLLVEEVHFGGRDVARRSRGALLRVEQAETKRKTSSLLLSARIGKLDCFWWAWSFVCAPWAAWWVVVLGCGGL